MKKLCVLLSMILLLSTALFAQEASETPKAELSLNAFGLFMGNYTAKIELPLVSSGLFSVGLRGTYYQQEIEDISLSGAKALLEARLYPSRNIRGFYVLVEGGYTTSTVSSDTDEVTLSSLPYMAGLGWKWVIQDFSIDLGFAYGKQVYLEQIDSDIVDLNAFPYNMSYDVYLLVGYRFK